MTDITAFKNKWIPGLTTKYEIVLSEDNIFKTQVIGDRTVFIICMSPTWLIEFRGSSAFMFKSHADMIGSPADGIAETIMRYLKFGEIPPQ